MVAVIGGDMPGAARLAAIAAARSGAGYVLMLEREAAEMAPHAIVRRSSPPLEALAAEFEDQRIVALLVGPGLGRDNRARASVDAAIGCARSLVIDGDALHLLAGLRLARLSRRGGTAILTPHQGEFDALFGKGVGSKIDRARDAAARSNAVVVFKGADTVVAAPDGQIRVAANGSPWLSTAGTGDVLAGAIAAMLARGLPPLEAAAAGVWFHGEAARRLGRGFIADDLAASLAAVL